MIMFESISQQTGWQLRFVLLLHLDRFFAFKAYRNKRDSKFRELAIISVLGLVAMVWLVLGIFQTDQALNNCLKPLCISLRLLLY